MRRMTQTTVRKQQDAHDKRQAKPHAAGFGLNVLGELPGDYGDENDVVYAQNDFKGGQRGQRGQAFQAEQIRHGGFAFLCRTEALQGPQPGW